MEQPRSIEERDDVKERLTRRRLELPTAGVGRADGPSESRSEPCASARLVSSCRL